MNTQKTGALALILRYLSTLRFPYLLVVAATLFVVDLLVPDFVPFADEILLGLVTLILSRLKRPEKEQPTLRD
jgi:hypothetical protein